MPMTGKDLDAIAEAVEEAKRTALYNLPDDDKETAMVALEIVTRELSTVCARQYKGAYGFKRGKFVEACGFPELRSN